MQEIKTITTLKKKLKEDFGVEVLHHMDWTEVYNQFDTERHICERLNNAEILWGE